MSDGLKTIILGCKSDFGTYQKLKKKAVATKEMEAEKAAKKPDKEKSGKLGGDDEYSRRGSVVDSQMMNSLWMIDGSL